MIRWSGTRGRSHERVDQGVWGWVCGSRGTHPPPGAWSAYPLGADALPPRRRGAVALQLLRPAAASMSGARAAAVRGVRGVLLMDARLPWSDAQSDEGCSGGAPQTSMTPSSPGGGSTVAGGFGGMPILMETLPWCSTTCLSPHF
jgi:hypothetical protein